VPLPPRPDCAPRPRLTVAASSSRRRPPPDRRSQSLASPSADRLAGFCPLLTAIRVGAIRGIAAVLLARRRIGPSRRVSYANILLCQCTPSKVALSRSCPVSTGHGGGRCVSSSRSRSCCFSMFSSGGSEIHGKRFRIVFSGAIRTRLRRKQLRRRLVFRRGSRGVTGLDRDGRKFGWCSTPPPVLSPCDVSPTRAVARRGSLRVAASRRPGPLAQCVLVSQRRRRRERWPAVPARIRVVASAGRVHAKDGGRPCPPAIASGARPSMAATIPRSHTRHVPTPPAPNLGGAPGWCPAIASRHPPIACRTVSTIRLPKPIARAQGTPWILLPLKRPWDAFQTVAIRA
jgi:hypothetical protein